MSGAFDTNKLMKSILHNVAQNHEIEIHCPKCGFFVGNYTANVMRELGKVYCNICEIDIELTVDKKLK